MGTSTSTLRRDLDALERDGIVKRTHGGVTFLGEKKALPIFIDRQTTMAKETEISAAGSMVKIFVIPTNEEAAIAKDTYELTQ